MIQFVNAKINIGLQIVRRRDDGYHNLRTVFYPVGKYAGTPENPEPFCDIVEVTPMEEAGFVVETGGRSVDCVLEKNLVWRAARLYFERLATPGFGARILLEKHLPDGAGCGGGSADGAMTLQLLSRLDNESRGGTAGFRPRDNALLRSLALELGADCPFFIENRPMYGEGVGEILTPLEPDLEGRWLVLVKPDIYISTREAFAGVKPKEPEFDLREIAGLDVREWPGLVRNDFEESVFPNHPELRDIKEGLYEQGALYASMTGSGSSIYGIFEDKEAAARVRDEFAGVTTIEGSYLLKM